MNHSCLPSTSIVPLTCKTLAVISAVSIPAGAELTTHYVALDQPCALRRQQLKDRQEFDCGCARCKAEAEALSNDMAERLLLAQEQASSLHLSSASLLHALRQLAQTASGVLD